MDFQECRENNYRWIKTILKPLEDSPLITKIKKKALIVSEKVNPKNLGREVRTPHKKYIHCLSGIFAEE
ncbi:MAG: hypothetical protein WD512_08960 [Candidatus Paceibacterota bacterium]